MPNKCLLFVLSLVVLFWFFTVVFIMVLTRADTPAARWGAYGGRSFEVRQFDVGQFEVGQYEVEPIVEFDSKSFDQGSSDFVMPVLIDFGISGVHSSSYDFSPSSYDSSGAGASASASG